jgi:hypothetical protein
LRYDSFPNQAYHLAHFAIAFWLLYGLWPRFAFRASGSDRLERWANLFVKTCYFYIVIGYLLVLARLYEVLALVFIVGCVLVFPYLRGSKAKARQRAVDTIRYRFYDALEDGFRLRQRIAAWRGNMLSMLRFRASPNSAAGTAETPVPKRRRKLRRSGGQAAERAPFWAAAAVFGGAAYIRFYDAVTQAAPPLSDSYVALAWMKYIERRILFHDGFYPAGFHITLANLHKFAAIDQLYVLKYTGPLMALFITLGLYFAVSRLSGNRYAGAVAAAIYGWAGYIYLHGEWERQIGTNSQEFALVFVLPAFYFAIRYLQTGKRDVLTALLAACSVAGFVHTVAYGYLALAVACAAGVAVLVSFRQFVKRAIRVAVVGCISAVESASQLLLAKWVGAKANESVNEFIASKIVVPPTALTKWDDIALLGIVLTLIAALSPKKTKTERLPELIAAVFGGIALLFYRYAGALSHSGVIVSRADDLWAIGATFCVGMGLASAWKAVRLLPFRRIAEPLLCAVLLVGLYFAYPLRPIQAYKMEWESEVRQYLRIAAEFRPKKWTMFSQDEGYDLALGNGFHSNLADFLARYDPAAPPAFPTRKGETEPDQHIAPDVFVFQQKHVYRLPKSVGIYEMMLPKYEQTERENAELEAWLEKYEQTHPKPEIYYEDDNLVVYHFQYPVDPLHHPEAAATGKVS